jgi:glycosyltransferase involved in cell wall biosynthesis
MTVDRRVAAVVPARDEAATVGETVRSLSRISSVERVVVVDDGSGDATTGEAAAAGAWVLRSARNRGKGRAVEAALDHVRADVYLLVDADTGASATGAARLLDIVLRGEADLAIGRLPAADGGGFGLVKRATGRLIERGCGFVATEPMSGQRAATRAVLEACRPLSPRFGLEAAMTTDAVRLGFRVVEVDVDMTHRPTGRTVNGFRHRAEQGMDVAGAMAPRLVRLR